jgi:histidinol-phosphate aminotransferase
MKIEELIRPEIVNLKRYFVDNGNCNSIKLHKNECPWSGVDFLEALQLNRYPDPDAKGLVALVAKNYHVAMEEIFLSRGSDEAIDLLIRLFGRAEKDAILIFTPTFGVYELYAKINGVKVVALPLESESFLLDTNRLANYPIDNVKIIFICSPNNPTGNYIPLDEIEKLCRMVTNKIIVVDEAYLDFSKQSSALSLLKQFPQLVVLKTLSKGYGLAGARCGMLFSSRDIVNYIKKISAPYTLSSLSIYAATKIFSPDVQEVLHKRISLIKTEKDRLFKILQQHPKVQKLWPSDANFILMQVTDGPLLSDYCKQKNLLVRNLNHLDQLTNCIRLTVGTTAENNRFLELLESFYMGNE